MKVHCCTGLRVHKHIDLILCLVKSVNQIRMTKLKLTFLFLNPDGVEYWSPGSWIRVPSLG